ncbi:MAG: F0F1 ATP synthase subunit gamma, partial [Candidatus Berkelbacteria bacterium]|nr:F0F1 ATP synthase subunit gamma [Candidatus Berkelbacteria bacterium]
EAVENFLNQKIDQFYIIYSHWVSSFIQKPACIQILPVVQQEGAVSNDYLLEPSSKELLNTLLPQFIEVQIYQALLESKASEYSARMMAMKNSTENAKDLMDELYLTYHSLRQSAITSELTEMTVAKQAME